MLNNEIKQKYISAIKKAESDSLLAGALTKFIETYDGTNVDEFNELMAKTFLLLIEFENAKIKAEGYDKLQEVRGDFQKQLKVLKSEHQDLEKGKLPATPPVGINIEE